MRKKRLAVLLVALALALLAVLVGLNVGGLRNRLLGGAAPGQITSLAVLPLKNLMGDPEQDYFVEGMHEELIATLSKIRALKLISRTSVSDAPSRRNIVGFVFRSSRGGAGVLRAPNSPALEPVPVSDMAGSPLIVDGPGCPL